MPLLGIARSLALLSPRLVHLPKSLKLPPSNHPPGTKMSLIYPSCAGVHLLPLDHSQCTSSQPSLVQLCAHATPSTATVHYGYCCYWLLQLLATSATPSTTGHYSYSFNYRPLQLLLQLLAITATPSTTGHYSDSFNYWPLQLQHPSTLAELLLHMRC